MRELNLITKSILIVVCASLSTSCAYKKINDTIDRVGANTAQADQYAAELKNKRSLDDNSFSINNGVWVDTTPVEIDAKEQVPQALTCNITYAPKIPVSLFDFVRAVTSSCNVPVRLTSDAIAAFSTSEGAIAQNTSVSTGTIPAPPTIGDVPAGIPTGVTLPSVPGSSASQMSTSYVGSGGVRMFTVTYQGALKGLLDRVTAMLGLSWHYDKNEGVVISYLDTQTFAIAAMPSITETSTVVKAGTSTTSGSQGAGGGGGDNSGVGGDSGTNTSTTVSMKNDLLTDIKNNLESMLTPGIGRLSLSPSTGSVTVTDTPQVLDRIRGYLKTTNNKITKQIIFNVKVLSITLKDTDELGLDMDLVYKSLNGKWGFNIVNNFADVSSNLTSGTVSINDPDDRFSGTNAIIKALSEQGRVSVVTSPSVTTLNLQPAPVQVARQTSYLAQRSVTTTANVGSQSSITPGTVTTGFNMTLLPSILDESRDIILQYNINLSSLLQIRKLGDDSEQVEMPEVDSRVFSQRVKLHSGETLILSGFEQTSENGNKAGAGDASWWGFGGSRSRSTNKDVIVVVITPVIM